VTASAGIKLGILGGGQLARMLALAASPYGILPQIYAPTSDEPAVQVSPYFFQGNLKDAKRLKNFLKTCDVVTFESEFMDAELLAKLSAETKTAIFPPPRLMGLLQDRLTQKHLLGQYKIPTAPFAPVNTWSDLRQLQSFGTEIVLKQRRFGYDGYGTFFLNPKTDETRWLDIHTKTNEGFIGEKKISFKRELALLLARDQFGTIIDFPLVESKQTNARCDWVMGPIKHPKEAPLRKTLRAFLKKENYIGLIAFELFDTGKELLVNEIAPRVHNSGHYSQQALTLDQFQAHVLAVCGHKLFNPKVLSPFAMANLLGQSEKIPQWPKKLWTGNTQGALQGHLHWYGKKDNRPHRKMGHINALGISPKDALKVALAARRKVSL
jgi:5-(carboxyamino)imidazole ribonucleotide synthase